MKEIIKNRKRYGRVNMRFLPIVVWLVSVACVVVVFRARTQSYQIIGFAQQQVRLISPTVTGRLNKLNATLHQSVSKGDLLASLDDSQLRIAVEAASAEIKRLRGELTATEDQLLVEAINAETEAEIERRRFEMDVERHRLDMLELKTTLEPLLIMLKDLELEIAIEKELFDKGAVTTDYAIKKAQVNYDALASQVKETRNMLSEAGKALENAQIRQSKINEHKTAHYSVDKALLPIKEAINAQEKVVEDLQYQRKALTLLAPADGIVSGIFHMPGETILPGEAIVTLTELSSKGIVGYLDDKQAEIVKAGDTVALIRHGLSPRIQETKVISIGPGVEEMPIRYWRIPDVPEWGRQILITIPDGFETLPGQAVGIKVL